MENVICLCPTTFFPCVVLHHHPPAIEIALLSDDRVFARLHAAVTIMEVNNHPKPIRLFDFALNKVKPTELERQHVTECEECQTVIAVFVRQFMPRPETPDDGENAA